MNDSLHNNGQLVFIFCKIANQFHTQQLLLLSHLVTYWAIDVHINTPPIKSIAHSTLKAWYIDLYMQTHNIKSLTYSMFNRL